MPAYEMPIKYITGNPAADFTGKRYYGVKFNADGNIIPAVAGDPIIGVIQEPNTINQPAQVMAEGISFAVLGGTVAPGDDVSMDANGKFVKATTAVFTDKATTDRTLPITRIVGTCVVGGDVDSIGSILLK